MTWYLPLQHVPRHRSCIGPGSHWNASCMRGVPGHVSGRASHKCLDDAALVGRVRVQSRVHPVSRWTGSAMLNFYVAGAPIARLLPQITTFALNIPPKPMTSDQIVSGSPIWQLGHVGKGADVFAEAPYCVDASCVVSTCRSTCQALLPGDDSRHVH